jgi:hypothetical protein
MDGALAAPHLAMIVSRTPGQRAGMKSYRPVSDRWLLFAALVVAGCPAGAPADGRRPDAGVPDEPVVERETCDGRSPVWVG